MNHPSKKKEEMKAVLTQLKIRLQKRRLRANRQAAKQANYSCSKRLNLLKNTRG